MKSPLLTVALLLLAAQSAWAQPGRPHGPDGRGHEMRRGNSPERALAPDGRRVSPDDARRDASGPRREEGTGGQRMSPAERDELRRQVREHGRDIYRER